MLSSIAISSGANIFVAEGGGFGFRDKMQEGMPFGTATQRAGVFHQLPALLDELGVEAAQVFDGSGIDPATLAADTRVGFLSMLEVMDRAALASGLPHLGLLLGRRFSFEFHGLIGRLMLAAPTLGRALNDFVAWQPGYSSGAIVYLSETGGHAAFGYGAYVGPTAGGRVLYDTVVAIGLRMLEGLAGAPVEPVEIHFSYRMPDEVSPYGRMAPAPVLFNQDRTCIILDSDTLARPLPRADPEQRRHASEALRAAMKTGSPDVTAQVRHALRRAIQSGLPQMEAVASELGVHPRTLRRRLAAEGAAFDNLRDDVRFLLARELLELTDLPIGDVGAALRYAAPGVFSEAFRGWSGTAPANWRRARRSA